MSEFLLLVIKLEIVKELGGRSEIVENGEHTLTNFGIDLLTISALASRSVLVQGVFNVDELSIGDIFDLHPLNIDGPWPLSILLPHILILELVVDLARHLGQTAEMLRFIHAEE